MIFGRRPSRSDKGGLPEKQEMLDFYGEHDITVDVRVIPIQKLNEACEGMRRSDAKYRFSIEMESLRFERSGFLR